MIEHISLAAQVEISMAREIDRRGLVGGGFIIEPQFILIVQRVSHSCSHAARKTILSVLADINELHRWFARVGLNRSSLPKDFSKYAVQMICPVVRGQLVLNPIQDEARVGDSIRYASHDCRGRAKSF